MNTELSAWWNKQCPVGNNKKYLVTYDGNVVAGFDKKYEAEAACEMYSKRSLAQIIVLEWYNDIPLAIRINESVFVSTGKGSPTWHKKINKIKELNPDYDDMASIEMRCILADRRICCERNKLIGHRFCLLCGAKTS